MAQEKVLEFGVGINAWSKAFERISKESETLGTKYNNLILDGYEQYKKAQEELATKISQSADLDINKAQAKIKELGDNLKLALKQKLVVDTKEAFNSIVENGAKAFAGFYTLKNTFGKYVSAAASFEEGINSIKNPLSLSQEQAKAYENAIKELARTTPTATSELISMSQSLIQNGVNASNLNEMTTLANKIAIGFGLDSTKVAELTGKLSQMGLKADEINTLAGAIHTMGESLQTNPQAILNTLDKLGESGKQIGFSLEQTAALSGALNSLGVGANESEKAIEKLYESFAKGDNNALLQMGIDPQDFANALKQNADVTLQAFMKMINKYDSHTQKQLLTSLVGAKESTALLKLAQNMDIYTEAKKKMNDINASSKLDGEVEAAQQGFNNQLKVFNNSITDLWQNIGNALLPTVSTLLDYFTKGVQLTSDFIANHQTLTQVIVGGVSALVAYKSALFAIESGKNIFKLIVLPITAFNQRIKLATMLTGAFNKKLTATSLVKNVRNSLFTYAVGAEHLVRSQSKAFANITKSATLNLASMPSRLFKAVTSFNPLAFIKSSFLAIPKLIASVGSGAINVILGAFNVLRVACLTNPIGLIIAAIAAVGVAVWKNWDIIKSFFVGVYDGFVSAFAPITESLTPTFNVIGSAISWVWDKIKAFFSFFTTQTEHSSEQLESAKSAGERFGQGLASAFKLIATPVVWVIDIIKELIDWIHKAYDYTVGLIDKASEITGSIGDSISDAWDSTKKAFSTGFGLWGDDEQKVIKNTQVNELIKLNAEYDKAKQEQVINNQNKQKSITDNKQVNIYIDRQETAQEIAAIVQTQNYSFADM
ncbi:phage tail tape measure protein [Campylobacter sp. RM12640]|uniref:phage tail tape measure protein n=1 Tax=unclassified Campylobacter TaxID=2593542 RepID=UPI001DF229A1|nr:phage tail tape measure protein [Campylobacter sp. RM12640]MBZ7989673.1 phage tail tape measure protein [Campylobacter sp. RM12635]MBZ7991731.1 phage tail tape measure protein [Campylobacter sp. RM9331]MBZ8005215.1 phage tail tape measure protein [Campylobacter sp. RM9332]